MTVVIIDLFEKIDIKKEDGAFISSVSCHMLGKLRMKGLSVYKTGQLVRGSKPYNPFSVFVDDIGDQNDRNEHHYDIDAHKQGKLPPLHRLKLNAAVKCHEKEPSAEKRPYDTVLLT